VKIEKSLERYFISRGKENKEHAFCGFVGDDGARWSHAKPWEAQSYGTIEEAEKDMVEIRERAKLKNSRYHSK